MADYGSLLALDSFASEESIRVAAYGRALDFSTVVAEPQPPDFIAAKFVEFIGGERWRLDALDVAIRRTNRPTNLDRLLMLADEIVAWVQLDEDEGGTVSTQDLPTVADVKPAEKPAEKLAEKPDVVAESVPVKRTSTRRRR